MLVNLIILNGLCDLSLTSVFSIENWQQKLYSQYSISIFSVIQYFLSIFSVIQNHRRHLLVHVMMSAGSVTVKPGLSDEKTSKIYL
jgi:hypothetical protein